jgi:DUF177 domain-containing protein
MISLNVKMIRSTRERFDRVYEADQLGPKGDGFRLAAPIRLGFDIYKDNDLFRLVGDTHTSVELECSRCLEPFLRAVDSTFDLRYQPHARNTGEGEREVEEDDLTTAFYENDAIDLGQLMREQVYLSLPMKPLCRDDCRGLCPVCGANLNLSVCRCAREWDDPRFAALKALKGEMTKPRGGA